MALGEARRLSGDRGLVIVDAGTGSGAIALSLAAELGLERTASVWAVDASLDALEVAAANLETVRARHRGAWPLVTVLESDWLGALPAELHGMR